VYHIKCNSSNAINTNDYTITFNIANGGGSGGGGPPGKKFRSAIFYHHSVGDYIYFGNIRYGSATIAQVTSVPNEIQKYNAAHASTTGWTSVSMAEEWNPPAGTGNNWADWDNELKNNWGSYVTSTYPVVIIKTCYIQGQETHTASDLSASEDHYRNIIAMMGNHTDHYFVIWVDYPSGSGGSNVHQNALAFAQWAKDTLATNNDVTYKQKYGDFPKNVYVFDELRLIANSDGTLPVDYYFTGWLADSNTNHYGVTYDDEDHPSPFAVNAIAPKFVQEAFNNAIAYER